MMYTKLICLGLLASVMISGVAAYGKGPGDCKCERYDKGSNFNPESCRVRGAPCDETYGCCPGNTCTNNTCYPSCLGGDCTLSGAGSVDDCCDGAVCSDPAGMPLQTDGSGTCAHDSGLLLDDNEAEDKDAFSAKQCLKEALDTGVQSYFYMPGANSRIELSEKVGYCYEYDSGVALLEGVRKDAFYVPASKDSRIELSVDKKNVPAHVVKKIEEELLYYGDHGYKKCDDYPIEYTVKEQRHCLHLCCPCCDDIDVQLSGCQSELAREESPEVALCSTEREYTGWIRYEYDEKNYDDHYHGDRYSDDKPEEYHKQSEPVVASDCAEPELYTCAGTLLKDQTARVCCKPRSERFFLNNGRYTSL